MELTISGMMQSKSYQMEWHQTKVQLAYNANKCSLVEDMETPTGQIPEYKKYDMKPLPSSTSTIRPEPVTTNDDQAFQLMLMRLKRDRDDNMDVGVSSFSLELTVTCHFPLRLLLLWTKQRVWKINQSNVIIITYILNKSQSFNSSCFNMYTWLEYSITKDGAFCYGCCFFSTGVHSSEECFITTDYRNWKHTTGKSGR